MDGCGRGAGAGGGGSVHACGGVGRELATFEPLTSKFQKTEPNAQLSSFGCKMVKIVFYNGMKTTAHSVLFPSDCF